MHIEVPNIDIPEAINARPIDTGKTIGLVGIGLTVIGVITFFAALWSDYPDKVLWGTYYSSLIFWMGLAAGAVITTAIVQIVRALWVVPVRRVAEANLAFLPWAYLLFLATYFGKEHLFPWANAPMPGREWWMQPDFVYARFAVLFLAFFYLLYRYVRHSLRSDLGIVRAHGQDKELWRGNVYRILTSDWGDDEEEVINAQKRMSFLAPIVVIFYSILWTLFATEMIGGMDTIWFSNMLGGFEFLANIYTAWAMIAVLSFYLAGKHVLFGKNLKRRQLWDLGMLTFGFCMLWGYTFFSQFLPQWYGNMPEETQWLMLRTRELPWKTIGYVTFTCAFLIPFITLLSQDVKKSPIAFRIVAVIIFIGVWLQKYMMVMPQLTPDSIPFGIVDIGIFLGFAGIYIISIKGFIETFPFMTVSHPQARGDVKSW